MDKERVDFLKRCLSAHPELEERLRIDPPLAHVEGAWRRIEDVKITTAGLFIESGGKWLLFHSSDTLQRRRETQIERILQLMKKTFRPRKIERLGCRTDRIRHWSGVFLKVMLAVGRGRLPIIAAYEDSSHDLSGRLLASLVVWWDHLRDQGSIDRIVALIPVSWGCRIVNLLSLLQMPVVCFQYVPHSGEVWQIYPSTLSDTRVQSPYVVYPLVAVVPPMLSRIHERNPKLDLLFRRHRWELSYRGLPVAWSGPGSESFFDLANPRPFGSESDEAFRRHLQDVIEMRTSSPSDRNHYNYRFAHERWLESAIVRNWKRVSADLEDQFYCQVPTWVAGERKVLDILALSRSGRIVVIELKIEKDLGLLFQGIDYWDRVRYHQRNGDLQAAGYFQEFTLNEEAPELFLISPLFEYHRLTSVFRRYLPEPRHICCIGINTDWKRSLKFLRHFRI